MLHTAELYFMHMHIYSTSVKCILARVRHIFIYYYSTTLLASNNMCICILASNMHNSMHDVLLE